MEKFIEKNSAIILIVKWVIVILFSWDCVLSIIQLQQELVATAKEINKTSIKLNHKVDCMENETYEIIYILDSLKLVYGD